MGAGVITSKEGELSSASLWKLQNSAIRQLGCMLPRVIPTVSQFDDGNGLAFDEEANRATNCNTNSDNGVTVTAEEAGETIVLMK